MKAGRCRCSATMSSLYLPRSGSRFWARIRLSMEGLWKGMPYFRQPAAIKPMSKSALWAARGRSPAKARKARRASSWEGAPTSISSVIPVRPDDLRTQDAAGGDKGVEAGR